VPASVVYVDANCQLGTPAISGPLGLTGTAEILAESRRCGIARVVAYHSMALDGDPQRGNRLMAEALSTYPEIVGVWVADPDLVRTARDATRLVADLSADGFRCVGFFPDHSAHGYRLSGRGCELLVGACEERRVPVFIDSREPDWPALVSLLDRHPLLHVVLTNIFYRHGRDLYPFLDSHANAHVETATFVAHGAVEEVSELFGPDRLIFGTHAPDFSMGAAVARVALAEVPDSTRDLIAGGTLTRLIEAALT